MRCGALFLSVRKCFWKLILQLGAALHSLERQAKLYPYKGSIRDNVDFLNQSPFFNVSLGSKELFHSNLIAWLGNIKDMQANLTRVMRRVFDLSHVEGDIILIEREKRNIDLTLHFDSEQQILIEVKVKSLPDLKQLEKYTEKNQLVGKPMLLSLYEPGPEFAEYKRGSFKDFGIALAEEFGHVPGYRGSVIKDYSSVVINLHEIMTNAFDRIEHGDFMFFKSSDEGKELNRALNKLRMQDLVYKGMFDRIKRVLAERGYLTDQPDMASGSPGIRRVKSEMYRGGGLVTGWVELGGADQGWPFAIYGGVEIQTDLYKIFLMTKNLEKISSSEDIGKLEKITEEIVMLVEEKTSWFDFISIGKGFEFHKIKHARVKYGSYNDRHGNWCFKYTKMRIGEKVSKIQLADSIAEKIDQFEKISADIKKAVETALR